MTGLSPYDEDEVESIELGIKSEFLDNRLRLNAALFRNDFNDFQISIQNVAGSDSSTRISNSPDPAKIEGLEFDLAVAVTDRLTLSGNYQYLNANDPITIDNPFIPNASLSVFIAQLPENAATTALDYAFPYTDFGQLDLHVDVNYSDDYFSNPSAGFAPVPDPHHWTIVNARLTLSGIQIGNNRSSLKLALWSKNLLDEDYTNFGFLVPGLNTQTRYYGDPRSVGISATFQY